MAQRVDWLIDRAPWSHVPQAWDDAAHAGLEPIASASEDYLANAKSDSVEFSVSWEQIQLAWQAAASYLPAVIPEETVSEDAASFRRSAGQHVRHLKGEVEEARQEVEALRQEAEVARTEQDNALEQLKSENDALKARIESQEGQLSEAIRENQSQFSAAQERHREEFQSALTGHADELDRTLDEAQSKLKDSLDSLTKAAEAQSSRLDELEEKATKTYNAVGNASVAGSFQTDADSQRRQKNVWRALAAAAFLLIAVAAAIELASSNGSLGWAETRSRIPVVLGLLGFATYAAAEARHHRAEERASRQREVELQSLDPFLVLVEDRDEAERVKLDYARRVFIADDSGPADRTARDDHGDA